jgi:bacteriocin-like protein
MKDKNNKKNKNNKKGPKAPTPSVKPVVKELSDQELESVTGGVTKVTDITSPRDIATG